MSTQTIISAALIAAMLTAPALASPVDKSSAPEHGAMDHDSHCGMPMGEGVISAVDVAKSKATIEHGPIAAVGWDKMTMTFAVEKPVDLSAFAAGDKVHFLLAETSSKKGKKAKTYSISAMCATDVAKETHEACMSQMHKLAMERAEKTGMQCKMDHMGMKHGDEDPAAAKPEQDHSGHH